MINLDKCKKLKVDTSRLLKKYPMFCSCDVYESPLEDDVRYKKETILVVLKDIDCFCVSFFLVNAGGVVSGLLPSWVVQGIGECFERKKQQQV